MQIRDVRRDRLQPGTECQRQAEQGAVKVEIGQRLAPAYNLRSAGKILHDIPERTLDLKDHAGAAGGNEGHIAAKLDCISEPLFAVNQDSFASNCVLAK